MYRPTFLTAATVALVIGSLAPSQGFAQELQVVTGVVLDAESGLPITQAEVAVRATALRALTGPDGSFELELPRGGTVQLMVSRLGYSETRVTVELGEEQLSGLVVELEPAAITLEELTVTPGRFSFGGASGTARQTMTRLDIESVPQMADDIFRAVNRLPGLTSNDYSAHFSIRGGRADETLILLDGLEIYEPYHLKDFNDGAISILDVETIGGVDLMTGGFPVKWGNRTSGIFSINSREPDSERTLYSFGLSLVNARAMAEGRYGDGRGSWIASARRGYVDLVLQALGENGLPSPSYYDVFAKTRYEINADHALQLNLLHARDGYTFDAASTTGFADSIDTQEFTNNRYGNSYAWATLNSRFGPRATVTTLASAGIVTASRVGSEVYTSTLEPQYSITSKRDFTVLGVKQDWGLTWSDQVLTEFGFDARTQDATFEISNSVGPDPDNPVPDPDQLFPVVTRSNVSRSGTTFGAYLSNRVRVLDPFTLEGGLRYDRSSFTGDADVSPRINALVRLGENNSLRVGWGRYRQMQGIGELAVLNDQRDYFPSELSEQWTVGLEHLFASGGVLRAEAYSKRGTGLRPVFRNWKGGLDVFPETNEDRVFLDPDSLTSRGVELYIRKELSDRTSVRASYALSKVEEHVSGVQNVNGTFALVMEPVHDAPQDQRHALNVDVTYRLRDKWSLNTSYAFHTGWPSTHERMEQVTTPEGGIDTIIVPEIIYGSRFPSYHRVDMRATRRWRTRRGDLRLFIEVSNLTNHKNVFAYDYFRMSNPAGAIELIRDAETGFIILPSIGISLTGNPFARD